MYTHTRILAYTHTRMHTRMPVTLQMELMHTLRRISEQFVTAVFSISQTRAFDAVVITVLGAISAIADAVMRRRATDHPSEV